jgi:hypothetical protein
VRSGVRTSILTPLILVRLSRQANDQVQKKLGLGYRSLGPKNLKNIPNPIEAFVIQGDGFGNCK